MFLFINCFIIQLIKSMTFTSAFVNILLQLWHLMCNSVNNKKQHIYLPVFSIIIWLIFQTYLLIQQDSLSYKWNWIEWTCMSYEFILILLLLFLRGSHGSWSYGSWTNNYLRNQCLSPLKLCVWTSFMARCTQYNSMW